MIIAANFKTNHTRKSTKDFISSVEQSLEKNDKSEVFIFPSAISLDSFETKSNLHIGTQNAHHVESGSFTGEIGSLQLDEFEIKNILIGHSERRHILHEDQESIKKKYNYYMNLGYTIIYCIGEPLKIKNEGLSKTLEYVYKQLEGIDTSYENLILAYEPVWAIGTGVTATLEDINNVHDEIKKKISKPLLYGGSVKLSNVKEICSLSNVDGALIGTASWDKEDFVEIIELTKDL
jgi:triosephosphate isomerase (TIM)